MIEIINGLLNRPDYSLLKNIPIGGLPGGSGNGVGANLFLEAGLKYHLHNALYMIIKGNSVDINVNKITIEG